MERLIFKLGKSPADDRVNQIVVELPSPDSVWYLVVEPDKAVPLVCLKRPKNAREVLDALLKQNGEGSVAQYIMNGYSKGKYKEVNNKLCVNCGKPLEKGYSPNCKNCIEKNTRKDTEVGK